MNTKLKPIYKEVTFWILMLISGPGILAAYTAAFDGTQPDWTALLASPIAVYLGIGRQYARGKAVEAHGRTSGPAPVESNAPGGYEGTGEEIPGYGDEGEEA